ncbi:MAG: ArnT family glycosyltransferase [Armatimonadota bacterium]
MSIFGVPIENRRESDRRGLSRPLVVLMAAIVAIAAIAHLLVTVQPVFSDEFLILGNFWDFVQNRTIIPEHTKYPAFYTYMVAPANAAFVAASVALGLPASIYDYSEWMALRPELAMWPSRLVSAVCWAVCAWAVFRLAREVLTSRVAALLSAAAFVSAFGLLEYSGYGLPDVAMMMWVTLALIYALRLVDSERPVRDAAIAGALAGVAMATKYSAAAVAAPLVAAVLAMEAGGRRGRAQMLGVMAGAGALAFIVACPGWVLAPASYWTGLAWERAHMARGHLGYFGVPLLGQLELIFSADPVLLLGGIAGAIVWARREPGAKLMVLIVAGAAVLAMAAPAKKQSLQYVFALYPVLAVLLGGGLCHLGGAAYRRATWIVAVLLLLTAAWGLLWGYRVALLRDSRVVGRQWINARIPEGDVVAVDWIDVPRLISQEKIDTRRDGAQTEMVRAAYESLHGFPAVEMDIKQRKYWTREFLRTTSAIWLVTSSTCYDPFFESGRFTRLPPPPGAQLRGEFEQKRDFYQALRDGYEGWRLEYEVYTGNGPHIQVYHRAR